LKVVTKQRFFGPYIIKDVIKRRPDVGIAYQLAEEKTGKVLKNLVTNDRLKRYNVDRTSFNQRLPRWRNFKMPDKEVRSQNAQNMACEQPKPLCIIRGKIVGGKRHYLVRYGDGKPYWCDWVNRTVLEYSKRQRAKAVRHRT